MAQVADWWQATFPKGRQTLNILDAGNRKVAIAYGEIGSGQPLFLLHGIGSWSYNWRSCVARLARSFRVICVDAKGYGFSETPPPPETMGHQQIELVRIIQALSQQPVAIAAESLGALTALAVAQTHPELIDRLVVINVPIFPKKLPSEGMRSIVRLPLSLIRWVDQSRLIRLFAPLVRYGAHRVRQEVVADAAAITAEEIYWLTYPYLNVPGTLTQFATDLHLAAGEIDRLQAPPSSHAPQPNLIAHIQQNLDRITCPTLILWSECDRWFPVEDGVALQARLPNARLQIIPGCGHVASSGDPKAVSAAILEFCGFV
ncbi:MAG: alpha/beta hydrolase [Drouetiella hepatica Uher 2000/2452]|jgi:pimeloyl-ACP methyl ester carboxylesterase|uniref:Alpha/beta hydrolase n=1 Tax=Drouetiella hepatica Uher 2000/2452 TaxID=904376 RepID=A0A951UL40_9CYAN|nr:alpha/beta hydrolase [Drouetiella hepatica Uher 2000/2452]